MAIEMTGMSSAEIPARGSFPDADGQAVERDVSYLFASLLAEGFVIEEEQTADCTEASVAS
jgi:hypothetical protein